MSSPMLLRTSISNTKKFLQKTLDNLKSLFSPRYQKLPKTPPHNNQFSCSVDHAAPSFKDLEKFYSDFTQQWDSEKGKRTRNRSKKKGGVLSCPTKQKKELCNEIESFTSLNNKSSEQKKNDIEMEKIEECDKRKNKRSLTHQREKEQDSSLNSKGKRGNGISIVEKTLRELEMLEKSNVDYILDIEEVLHYYSRLTCPLYLEIVDKFFIEMYSEFFGGASAATPRTHHRMKLRSIRS
ncbi:hypothetical protein RJT34_04722 [Clitoria ternatea]|uniref:OVATE domain-containing protein n=1 Tax=Clitoria ternatea TaxID=43366 RepID=A0AAN9KPM4_CLITE